MLSAVAGLQGLAPLPIDLNKTHATNPLWPGHARFHVVWQSFHAALLGIPEVALIWWAGPGFRGRFYLAAGLAALSMLAFVIALVLRNLYGGTLHDPNGIQPLRVRAGWRTLEIDGNAFMVFFGLIVLSTAVLLFRASA
jgi:hypothetical protein